jgi:hypothetical protein
VFSKLIGLSITLAFAADGKPHPKSKHQHHQTYNQHILRRTTLRGDALTTLKGDALTTLRGDGPTTSNWAKFRGS